MSKNVLLKPRLSEKAYALSTAQVVYVFDIPLKLTKQGIVKAIQDQFSVTVVKVNVLKSKPKAKRSILKKGRLVRPGHNQAYKKSYVTLKAGESLPFFAAAEEAAAKQEETQAKVEKVLEKQASKAKPTARRGLHLRHKKEGAK